MENDRKTSRGDIEKYDLEILLRRPSLRSNIPRRISQICREELATEETKCGAGCIRGQWIQSFANRNSFTLVYGILASFYASYYAYFYGVVSTLERRFQISSQTIGIIAATGDIVQVIVSLILSRFVPKTHRPRWMGVGVLLIVLSAIVFALPHFLYERHEPKNTYASSDCTYRENGTDVGRCDSEESELCTQNLEGKKGPIGLFTLAQGLHGTGGSLYFVVGKTYENENTEKFKPVALLSLLSVLKILGPAFGYWLSSVSLKIPQYPKLIPEMGEGDPHWIGAWWLGSLVIGFILIVPGFLVTLFPVTLPKAAVKRIHTRLQGIARDKNVEKQGRMSALKKLFLSPTITCTHFAAVFNILGFVAYFTFLPKYVEIQYGVSASHANLVAGSVTLISAAAGIVTANSVITRYRPSARALASWTVIVGILSVGGLASYIFLGCQENDNQTALMVNWNSDSTCKCANSSIFPVCDENNQPFVSFCHAGCANFIDTAQGYGICNGTVPPSTPRKVFNGFCDVDCSSTFLKYIIVTCSMAFVYATGRTSTYWFETKSEDKQEKSLTSSLGMLLGFVASIPVPIVFGYLLDESCLLWEGNCKWSGNCWLYDNRKLRYTMNLPAIGFAIVGILFDIGVWFLVKEVELFDDADYYTDENDEM